MIIYNNREMATNYVSENADKLMIEIRTSITDPKELLNRLRNGENITNIASISAYKTGDGSFATQDEYTQQQSVEIEDTYNTVIMDNDDIEEALDNMERSRPKMFQAFEAFNFNRAWRNFNFEPTEITMGVLEKQLSLALGIMPTLGDQPDKSVEELQRLSAIGDKLYWPFAEITTNNHLPSRRDIEFFESLNDYEKRIITGSGVHPGTMLALAEYLKYQDPGRLLTSHDEKVMHKPLRGDMETAENPALVASMHRNPGTFYCPILDISSIKNIPFYTAWDRHSVENINQTLDSKAYQIHLRDNRSIDAKRTAEILATAGYLHDLLTPTIDTIAEIYAQASADIQNGTLAYNINKLTAWRDEMRFEDFAMAMWYQRVTPEGCHLVQSSKEEITAKYREIYETEFKAMYPDGHTNREAIEFAKSKYKTPKAPFMEEAERYSREIFRNFVPRVLEDYVFAQYAAKGITDVTQMTGDSLREIVASFDRTSVSKIAKYKNRVLFALSNRLNFAEIKQEHAEIIGVYGANYAKILMDKKFPEWYLAHKNVSNSDLVALMEKIEIIPHFKIDKSAEDLVNDVLYKKAKRDCELMENKYHYHFSDNELAIKGRHVMAQEGKLKMYMLQANDYRNFTIGYDTNCCQHYGNAGESCVWKYTTDPFAGAVVIERDGAILGQGFIWTDEARNTLVFDNMEFANDRDVKSFQNIIAKWCEAMPYENIHVGTGYNQQMNGWGKKIPYMATLPTTISNNRVTSWGNGNCYSDYHDNARALKTDGEVLIQCKSNVRVTSRPDEPTRWDILARPENAIWLNDCSVSIEERLQFARDFLENQTPEIQMKAVKKNPIAIRYIEHPTEEVQEYVVQKDPQNAMLIQNPCERVQSILIDIDPSYIRKIQNPTEAMSIRAVSQNGLLLEAIPNPTEEVIKMAVRENGYAIKFIEHPSEEVQRIAVQSTPKVVTMIPYASENTQSIAVTNNPEIIRLMDNPSERLQMIAVEADPYALNSISNPSYNAVKRAIEKNGLLIRNYQYQYPELRMVAVHQNGFALRALKDPTVEECIEAVRQNRATQNLIKDPELLSNVLMMLDNDTHTRDDGFEIE